jgi:cellulose synthase/poly-beta-1,6-N-acetylglucosamine synthase-like glycosyltransferase
LFLLNLGFYRRLPKFPLAPGFNQVDPAGQGENRLSGFQSRPRPDTGLKPGANEICRVQSVSVLIPARNEEQNLPATLSSVLANRGVEFEVVVLDDHSTDRTAEIVRAFAAKDARVRLESAPALPAGWCGKPHACHVLAQRANHPWLVFMDADVRLEPDALSRMVGFLTQRKVALASGVPRQELCTFSERLLLPLIHFVTP